MWSLKFSIFLCILGIAACQQVASDDERPFLRILAPKFICNDKKAAQGNNLTIGLQTREGQKLRYSISVDFEMLGEFKSQQHTLSIWKNIRLLQKKFVNISDEISQKNQIEINAQEVWRLSSCSQNFKLHFNLFLVNTTSDLHVQSCRLWRQKPAVCNSKLHHHIQRRRA